MIDLISQGRFASLATVHPSGAGPVASLASRPMRLAHYRTVGRESLGFQQLTKGEKKVIVVVERQHGLVRHRSTVLQPGADSAQTRWHVSIRETSDFQN
ncbi:MAG TPA: hypothetical protein VN853_03125, partial [Polyangia bacterium]|nr:hypothetical protein [Polyangia bacterium]